MGSVFICVYRHLDPDKKKIKEIKEASLKTPLLNKFLETYSNNNNFYDWGDDPSFFAAKNYLGDEKFATWGVCRANVRRQLKKDDIVIFICGKEYNKCWDYYFIGYCTVSNKENDRIEIWKNEKYKDCRTFYNILIDRDGKHLEPFGGEHKDYGKRIKAGYIFFEPDPKLTNLNFSSPPQIASCDPKLSPLEIWNSQNPSVSRLHTLLFKDFSSRRSSLRSIHKQISHPHIRITNLTIEQLLSFRSTLYEISKNIKKHNPNKETD